MSSFTSRPVSRRRVFYIPGYDPIHPRRYRELYRKEGAEQAAISGYSLTLSARPGQSRYGWHVDAKIEGAEVESDFTVLVWSDIVRTSMERGIAGTYLLLLRTAWTYIVSGALFRLMRLRKGPVIAALYPVGFLLVQLVLAGLAGWAVFLLVAFAWWVIICGSATGGMSDCVFAPASTPVAAAAALAVTWGLLEWFRRRDNRFFAYYLMHDYAYSARHEGANPPELEERLSDFTAEIAEALKGETDEVLIVGHSSGAHLGVSIVADLIRSGLVPPNGPALSFLTLGQVVPMVSFLPEAHRLRADLRFLSAREELTWIDVTAPGDGCAFALCDPVAVSGVAPEDQRWPLILSAAFTQTLSPVRWKALRWRFFRLHFQYLCAFDRPGDYDYFRITAGPLGLAERFAARAPSPSCIRTPASKYTSTAA